MAHKTNKLALQWQIGLAIGIGGVFITGVLLLFPYFQLRKMGIRDLAQQIEQSGLALQLQLTSDLNEGVSMVEVTAKLLAKEQTSEMRRESYSTPEQWKRSDNKGLEALQRYHLLE